MAKIIYYAAIVGGIASFVLLLGLAGASDAGAPMTDILPRAVLYLVCFALCSVLSHIAKNHEEPARRANGL